MLAAAPMQEQKQMLGERLFPLIQVFDEYCDLVGTFPCKPQLKLSHYYHHISCLTQRQHAELAGKITGMLLEIDNSELLHMLEDPASLQGKVQHIVLLADQLQVRHRRTVGHR